MLQLLRNIYSNIYLWGAPVYRNDQQEFINDLKSRFSTQPEEAEIFMERWIDRTISKAVGLLQYNAVLLAITGWLSTQVEPEWNSGWIILSSFILGLVSSLLMMLIMHSHWSKSHTYGDPWLAVEASTYLTIYRSILLTVGLLCGGLAAILDIVFLLISVPYS